MKVTDALIQPVVVGNRYGYCLNGNGITTIVTGTVCKIDENTRKVTLDKVEKRWGAYGPNDQDKFEPEARKRTVYGCHLFPVLKYE